MGVSLGIKEGELPNFRINFESASRVSPASCDPLAKMGCLHLHSTLNGWNPMYNDLPRYNCGFEGIISN